MKMLSTRCVFKTITVLNKHFTRTVATAENAKQTQIVKPWKEIPGPPSLPFIGPLLSFLPGGKLAGYKGVQLSERMYQLYGPIVRLDGMLGGNDVVLLFDPEAVQQVFQSEEVMPIRPTLKSLEYYRKRYNKTYDPKRLTGLGLELRTIRDENNKVTTKFNIEMNLWALESIGVVALGTRLNCFDPNLPADSSVRRLIQIVHDVFNIADKLDHGARAWSLFATPMFKKAMKIYDQHNRLTKYFIDRAMKNLEQSQKSSAETHNTEKPILEKLIEIDVDIAYMMASDMLLGGVDTMANTVMPILYLLAINPEKQNRLRKELSVNQTRKPYLRACIKEAMRLMPVVNGNIRQATKEYNLLGYNIPKDVFVRFPHQYMCIMKEHYPKPDEYIPERWLTEKDDPLYHGNTPPLVMAPFGLGVRMCIGRRIAELEIETITSKLIENFQIDWTGPEPLQISPTLFNYVTEPFHFVFKDL